MLIIARQSELSRSLREPLLWYAITPEESCSLKYIYMHVQTVHMYKDFNFSTFPQSVRRRRHAHPLVVGIVSAVNSVPHADLTATSKPEEYNFSLVVNNKDSTWHNYNNYIDFISMIM